MTVLTPPTGDALAELELKEYTLDEYNLLPKIAPSLPLYQKIFEMAMDKVVAVLTKMSGEKKYFQSSIQIFCNNSQI